MRRFVIGTAGHVDHGKTTLVRALTGVDTDRLPEEKRRGITIELGFAPWDLGGGLLVSIIDVPGHRRLVHTMIAGAIGVELVMLVVAADEGVMPQTREHVAACEILGIRRAVVVVTKLDRAGEELARLAGEEARELLGGRFACEVAICSARTGEGLDAVRDAIRGALRSLPPPGAGRRARLSVDRVFSVRGAGTVVTGTLVEGSIAVGAPLVLVGEAGAQSTSARGLHVHDEAVQRAEAPTRLALNLAGLPLEAVRRGDVVTDDPSVAPTQVADVSLRPVTAVRSGMSASLYVGTARAPVRVRLFGPRHEAADGELLARLRLSRPLAVVGGDRFVLRGSDASGPAGAVIGGGVVLDARPERARDRGKRLAALRALAAGTAAPAVSALIAEARPRPFSRAAMGARFVITATAIERAADTLVEKGEVARLKALAWIARGALVELARAAREEVGRHHEKAPLDRGLALETLRQKLAAASSSEAAEAAIRIAAQPGQPDAIVIEGDVARLARFDGRPTAGTAAGALAAAARAVEAAGLRGVTEHAASEATGAAPRDVKAILAKLVRDGLAVHAGDLWFAKGAVDAFRARVVEHLAQRGRLTVIDTKAISGLGRKQTILLLELFDREGVTRREGDERVLARSASGVPR